MTRVLIVEDQSMPRTLFEMYVNQSENYTLAGSISNADMTDYHCENSDVDLILMDICTSMGANGLEAGNTRSPFIVLSISSIIGSGLTSLYQKLSTPASLARFR